MSQNDPLGVGPAGAQSTEREEDRLKIEAEERAAAEFKEKVDANVAWVESTEVWLGDFERGSESFVWDGVTVNVIKPPDLRFILSGGAIKVNPDDEAAYRQWGVDNLPSDLVLDFSSVQAGLQIQHWWLAKQHSFRQQTGKAPNFTPPHPHAPGGRTLAGIG